MARIGDPRHRTCKNASSGGFGASDNESTTPIAVGLVDSDGVGYPDIKPTVRKAVSADNNVYGVFVGYDVGSGDVTVATGGIQAFTKSAASAATDIGDGISGDDTTSAGQVTTGDNKGSGVVVGRSGSTLWVDLDASSRGTA